MSRADAQAQGGSGEISRLEDELAAAQAALASAKVAAQQAAATAAEGEPTVCRVAGCWCLLRWGIGAALLHGRGCAVALGMCFHRLTSATCLPACL